MKTLFVSNMFPVPPRNGVTIPFFNYARMFRDAGSVDLLVLKKNDDTTYRSQNEEFFRQVYECPVEAKQTLSRVAGQLAGRSPYFAGWRTIQPLDEILVQQEYDVVISTPRSVVSVVQNLRTSGQIRAGVHVAAVNDIATLAKKNLARAAFQNRASLTDLGPFAKLRMQRIGLKRSELKLLSDQCDLFIVQSDAESKWLNQQGNNDLVEKSIQLSNGVDNDFFAGPMERSCDSCVYIGRLDIDGEFSDRIDWLVEQVWPQVFEQFPESSFTLSGKCPDRARLTKLMQPGVRHREFVEDPLDLFRDQAVLLAPIYKGYGLINRVIQSMAAGTVVIGDKTAFNAIPDFEPGKHGLVAERPDDFAKLVIHSFKNPSELIRIRESARALIAEHFQWDSRFFALCKKLKTLGVKA